MGPLTEFTYSAFTKINSGWVNEEKPNESNLQQDKDERKVGVVVEEEE